MRRFITEYANYQKAYFTGNDMIEKEVKEEAIENINGALSAREKGMISIDETMRIISDPIA